MPVALPEPLPFEQDIHELEAQLAQLEATATGPQGLEAIRQMKRELLALKRERYAQLQPWDIIQIARHRQRPQFLDYVQLIFDEFVELHGDRAFGDDRALRTGFARLDGQKVMLIGHQKGKTLAERQQCYFGCAHPEGYRKALHKMKLAAKFRLPIICLIDTPGAFPGVGAEERGQAQWIAYSILEMTRLPTPIICVVIGEGGSGGALGIGVGDRVAMMQYAYYSVISPEGCAGILWRTATEEARTRAAAALKLTAQDLLQLHVIDHIIPEPLGGAHRDPREAAAALKNILKRYLRELVPLAPEVLLQQRYDKFRRMGVFLEAERSNDTPILPTPQNTADVAQS
jgi:acetyl-CoA carboxylase carboxyl transferase subunit alpha